MLDLLASLLESGVYGDDFVSLIPSFFSPLCKAINSGPLMQRMCFILFCMSVHLSHEIMNIHSGIRSFSVQFGPLIAMCCRYHDQTLALAFKAHCRHRTYYEYMNCGALEVVHQMLCTWGFALFGNSKRGRTIWFRLICPFHPELTRTDHLVDNLYVRGSQSQVSNIFGVPPANYLPLRSIFIRCSGSNLCFIGWWYFFHREESIY